MSSSASQLAAMRSNGGAGASSRRSTSTPSTPLPPAAAAAAAAAAAPATGAGAAAAAAAAAATCETQQQLPPLTAIEQLALHSQPIQPGGLTFVPASALRAAARAAPPPPPPLSRPRALAGQAAPALAPAPAAAVLAASSTAADPVRQPFHAVICGHQLGEACGPYLISALLQLPPTRRQEVLSSLQVMRTSACTIADKIIDTLN